uniref:folate gamma-glutamyl hydrolase n=1 Tax=Nelumbo nucifera TaxID=4432 RepID=A0A822ZUF6_NELNU|nr:TPA_asm: hypothetical protein HUJ06_018117 [Nelumbo nucifera]
MLSSQYSKMWSCLWIVILISLSKELIRANSQSILLPGEIGLGSWRSSSCQAPDPALYFRPVIGILTHPAHGASNGPNASNASLITASYVKFVESAGARVIPLIYNEPPEILAEKLSLVNGVLLPGGWAKTGLFYEIVEKVFKHALEKNDSGDHFPVFAICLSFELLTMIISKDVNILERFNALNQASTLQFTENSIIEGTVFQRFSPELLKKLTTDCIVMENHQYGISLERFQKNPSLSSFFRILTTSKDRDGKVYVSTVKSHNYPVSAFQWHPEVTVILIFTCTSIPLYCTCLIYDFN